MIGYFHTVPTGIATVIFVTTYSGLVFVCVYRIWDDVKILADNAQIIIIVGEKKSISTETYLQLIHQRLFDERTYKSFLKLLCGFPPEYTVFKFNRFFFLNGISSLPGQELQDLVTNQKAFSQLITRLKSDDYIRTDHFSFSIQLGKWELKRKKVMENKAEFQEWQEIANRLIELNKV